MGDAGWQKTKNFLGTRNLWQRHPVRIIFQNRKSHSPLTRWLNFPYINLFIINFDEDQQRYTETFRRELTTNYENTTIKHNNKNKKNHIKGNFDF